MNTLPNGDTIVTTRIRLAENPDEESVDISTLDMQEMDRLREADPFMYHSIMRERRRSSLFGLEDDEDIAQEEEEGAAGVEFDLRDMDQGSSTTRGGLRGSLLRALSGLRRQSSTNSDNLHNVSEADLSNGQQSHSDRSGASVDGSHNSGGNRSGGSVRSGGQRMLRPALSRRRSSLYSVNEEGASQNNDAADADAGAGGVTRRNSSRPFSQSLPHGHAPNAIHGRRLSHRNSITSLTSTGSSVVQRKRRFSTEAHSSLIMSNLESSLRGSMLSDSPDLDSLLDEDLGGSDDEDLLSFLRSD